MNLNLCIKFEIKLNSKQIQIGKKIISNRDRLITDQEKQSHIKKVYNKLSQSTAPFVEW